ncbi:flagellar assembly protein FliX [Rickettsiales endosymbiont of Stachyamoeba lipophora]|uniref:flagellar assembly protein FliX n=1 Tax=Rickettsiales endosymbiont of Stachyamoeba lipophora TaxID=2486578 RepID=UPI000F64A1E3|nr:flagellar assembly protein FliX [Rickettsiales endosymbiont of Stachyamoeba lipophora]AZL15452.1 hypothetical protein EF513_02645 [Rickettsiales endosymbiont of Stachyamoeba lipophora]
MKIDQINLIHKIADNIKAPVANNSFSNEFAKILKSQNVVNNAQALQVNNLSSLFALQQVAESFSKQKQIDFIKTRIDKLKLIKFKLLLNNFDKQMLQDLEEEIENTADLIEDLEIKELLEEINILSAATIAKLKKQI